MRRKNCNQARRRRSTAPRLAGGRSTTRSPRHRRPRETPTWCRGDIRPGQHPSGEVILLRWRDEAMASAGAGSQDCDAARGRSICWRQRQADGELVWQQPAHSLWAVRLRLVRRCVACLVAYSCRNPSSETSSSLRRRWRCAKGQITVLHGVDAVRQAGKAIAANRAISDTATGQPVCGPGPERNTRTTPAAGPMSAGRSSSPAAPEMWSPRSAWENGRNRPNP